MQDETLEPFGGINPNSQHQLWSRWTFLIEVQGMKLPSSAEVLQNARVYFRKLFGSAGRIRIESTRRRHSIVVEVEGVPAHDPDYVDNVERDVRRRFVRAGFHADTTLEMSVGVLAGDVQDGRPPDQLIVLPRLPVPTSLAKG